MVYDVWLTSSAFLEMFGLSDHDLMFTKKPDDFDYEAQMSGGDFNHKVSWNSLILPLCSHEVDGPIKIQSACLQYDVSTFGQKF